MVTEGLTTGQAPIAKPIPLSHSYNYNNPQNRIDYTPPAQSQPPVSKDHNSPPRGGNSPNNRGGNPFNRGGNNPYSGGGPNYPGGGGGGPPFNGGGGGGPPSNGSRGGNHFPGNIPRFPPGGSGGGGNGPPGGGGGGNGPPSSPGGSNDPHPLNKGDESDLREYIPYGTNVPTIKAELKHENLPTWDGNHETAIEYFWKVQQLASLGGWIPQALGYWLWNSLKAGSKVQVWFSTLTGSEQSKMRSHYIFYLKGIKEMFLGKKWQMQMNVVFESQAFRQSGHEREAPSTFIARRIMYT